MRIVFMGSDEIACPTLAALAASERDEVVAVITQPDRPSGRRRKLTPCALKAFATERKLPVYCPDKIGEEGMVERLRELAPDMIIVVAYGQYIPGSILAIPRHHAINLHPSLLPKYRGASPIQWAVANGDRETGVSILYVTAKMDAGDIILQERIPIGDEDTAVTMAHKLADLGARMILDAVDLHRQGTVPATPQDEAQAVTVYKLSKEDGRIDWSMDAATIRHRIRGFQPWPLCFCEAPKGAGHFLRIYKARLEDGAGEPGEILDVHNDGPLVATGAGALRLLDVQPEGKSIMTGKAYLCGHPLPPHTFFG
ncbi:MAG: methionyl-tRNA formyltransferase [Spartobacteria bacterium]|nr:methionyl-tRNA formyltransferase [Spartobacteria bacterium]